MKSARPVLMKLHRWTGIALALLFVVQGLSGVMLMFRDEIEPMLHPSLQVEVQREQATLQQMLETVENAHPDAQVGRIEFYPAKDRAVLFRLTRQDGAPLLAAVDPYRNLVVRDGSLSAWPGEWLFYLHDELLAGETGHMIVGLEGLALVFLALTGPIIWWPGIKRFAQGFRVVTGRGADLQWRTLHRAVGAGAAILLLVSASTGAAMVFKGEVRALLGAIMAVSTKPSPKIAAPTDAKMVPLDQLLTDARSTYGQADLLEVRFSDGGKVAVIFLESELSARPDAAKQIYFNRYDGNEVGRYIAGDLPAGTEFIDWLFPVHTGKFGGLAGQLTLLIGGISMVGLSLSGLWLWYSRNYRRKRRASAPSVRSSAEAA